MKVYEEIEMLNNRLKELMEKSEKDLGTSNKKISITENEDILISTPKLSHVYLSINEAKDVYLFLRDIFEKEI